jgi:hypothetical protein
VWPLLYGVFRFPGASARRFLGVGHWEFRDLAFSEDDTPPSNALSSTKSDEFHSSDLDPQEIRESRKIKLHFRQCPIQDIQLS